MASTIEDFLYSVDPFIDYVRTGQGKAHTRVQDPKQPLMIRRWHDFDLKTLLQMGHGIFGQALQQKFDFPRCMQHGMHRPERFEAPEAETILDDTLVMSVRTTVSCALHQTQERFYRQRLLPQIPRPGITMLRGPQAAPVPGEATKGGLYRPDWAGCFRTDVASLASKYRAGPPETELPGDTKLRWKVDFDLLREASARSPTMLFNDLGRHGKNVMNGKVPNKGVYDDGPYQTKYLGVRYALIQIYTYCFHANCRYGFVITETQLLVVRIRPNSRSKPDALAGVDIHEALKEDGLLEYRLISYNREDRNRLSVNLALWWLHLLAAVDNEIHWWYTPLMEMSLTGHVNRSERIRREASEEYEAPPDSQLVENVSCDLRPPPPRPVTKRKQLSTHRSGCRGNPSRIVAPAIVLDVTSIHADPELDLEMIPYPPQPILQERSRDSQGAPPQITPHQIVKRTTVHQQRQPQRSKRDVPLQAELNDKLENEASARPRSRSKARPPMHRPGAHHTTSESGAQSMIESRSDSSAESNVESNAESSAESSENDVQRTKKPTTLRSRTTGPQSVGTVKQSLLSPSRMPPRRPSTPQEQKPVSFLSGLLASIG